MAIFISGSISIKKLPKSAIRVLDEFIDTTSSIIVGDASGIDSLVQKYLSSKNYPHVNVYHMGEKPRNNIGNWTTVSIQSNGEKGRAYYELKDMQMVRDCTSGVLIWDGKSRGTERNYRDLSAMKKPYTFINPRVMEVKGDIFDYIGTFEEEKNVNYKVVHCISADFALGMGIAKELDKRYDLRDKLFSAYPDYEIIYKEMAIHGGDMLVVDKFCNLVTKAKYNHKPTYLSLEESLYVLLKYCITHKVKTLLMPFIGCGLDRLKWSRVCKMLHRVFIQYDIDIIVVSNTVD